MHVTPSISLSIKIIHLCDDGWSDREEHGYYQLLKQRALRCVWGRVRADDLPRSRVPRAEHPGRG